MIADPHRALLRALARRYPDLTVLESRSEPWFSVSFIGSRHRILCAFGPDLKGIDDEEFAIPGHFVAEIAAVPDAECVIIEALTVEAC